jgi:hypothetical protein
MVEGDIRILAYEPSVPHPLEHWERPVMWRGEWALFVRQCWRLADAHASPYRLEVDPFHPDQGILMYLSDPRTGEVSLILSAEEAAGLADRQGRGSARPED